MGNKSTSEAKYAEQIDNKPGETEELVRKQGTHFIYNY